jgi:hypothetical protein
VTAYSGRLMLHVQKILEIVDRLLLYSEITSALWSSVFGLLGLK